MSALLLSVLVLLQTAPSGSLRPAAVVVPLRVYDTGARAFSTLDTMVAALGQADVALVGEHHDHANGHRVELAILEGLQRRRLRVTVSFEMFERDVQADVDRYLVNASSEDEFLKAARPWPRYRTDYRPLLEFAKANRWPVVAANVPRRHATAVARAGLGAIDALADTDRVQAARELQCPRDAYFERFAASMGEHPAAEDAKTTAQERAARLERYYHSQCVKDETMAESIALARGRDAIVVHFTGSFHSDFRQGTAERTRRRLPAGKVMVVSILPAADLGTLVPGAEDLSRADFLVYTTR